MLVLDTQALTAGDRADAFQTSVSQNCTTSAAVFEDPSSVRAQVHAHDLGPAKVLTIEATGTTLRRTPRMARQMNDCPIALALPIRTTNHLSWDREDRAFATKDLMLVDLSAPYVYGWNGAGASYAFHVDYDELGLPMDTIRRAAEDLRASPLYPLVRDHIASVLTTTGAIVDSGAAAQVGVASVQLMHALVVSAAGDVRRTRESLQSSLEPRVRAYVAQHLRNPDLSPTQIAAAHNISVRVLYKLYEEMGQSLEQTVIEQRLAGARADLAAPALQYRSIGAIARSWGFTSPSFFSTRFHRSYGMTPRQWRARGLARPDSSLGQDQRSQLIAAGDLEFAVDPTKVMIDRVATDPQTATDLAVGVPDDRHLGHHALLMGEASAVGR